MSRIDVRNPGGDAPALQKMDVLLVHRDGACWSPVEFGQDSTPYPRLSIAPARLRLVKSGVGPISDGDTIRVMTTEPLVVGRNSHILGTWKSDVLYYSKSYEGDNQNFHIHRIAGPGPIAYGDEIYLVNVYYDQRIGRKKGEIYLTSGDDLTDTFTLVDPATPPLVTSFNSLNQTHTGGEQVFSDTRGWVWHQTSAGQEMLSVETILPAGSYYALVQLAPDNTGQHCATIRVQMGAKEIAARAVTAEEYPMNDWQRTMVPFTTTSNGLVRIVVTAVGEAGEFRTGAVSITPAGQRPFYVIAHACNTVQKAYDAVEAGANAIEFDITPVRDGSKIKFNVYHPPHAPPALGGIIGGILGGFPGTLIGNKVAAALESPSTPFADYISGIIENGVANRVALLQFDIKPGDKIDNYDYGFQLANETKRLGIGPDRAFFSVENPAAAREFYRGVRDTGMFNGACEASSNGILKKPDLTTDPSIWYNVGRTQADATFLGLGIDPRVVSTWMTWLEAVSYTTAMRDRDQLLKKVYFWTLNTSKWMRKVLDLNVDGIIVNDPATLLAVLREQPYAQMFRLATVDDSPTTVYGWSAPSEAPVAASSAPQPKLQPQRQTQTQP